jgi:hypothetical protein
MFSGTVGNSISSLFSIVAFRRLIQKCGYCYFINQFK